MNRCLYMPILVPKKGELDAWGQLPAAVKSGVLPLFAVHKPDFLDFDQKLYKRSLIEHLDKVVTAIHKKVGSETEILLDLSPPLLALQIPGTDPVGHAFDAAAKLNLRALPVARLDHDDAAKQAIKRACDRNGGQAALRVAVGERLNADGKAKIRAAIAECGILVGESTLILDLGYLDERNEVDQALAVAGYLTALDGISNWRHVVVAGGAFPRDLSKVAAQTIATIPRREYVVWKQIREIKNLKCSPIFGDYGIAHPVLADLDVRKITVSAAIRYSSENAFVVVKGSPASGRFGIGFDQTAQLCQALVGRAEYCGERFSAGDSYIYRRSQRAVSCGGATTWRQVATNHHIHLIAALVRRMPPERLAA